MDGLPYEARVYLNNQVLVPAGVVRRLGIGDATHANVLISVNGTLYFLEGVRLLRSRFSGASRWFTIPKPVRDKLGIRPFDTVRVLCIQPIPASTN